MNTHPESNPPDQGRPANAAHRPDTSNAVARYEVKVLILHSSRFTLTIEAASHLQAEDKAYEIVQGIGLDEVCVQSVDLKKDGGSNE